MFLKPRFPSAYGWKHVETKMITYSPIPLVRNEICLSMTDGCEESVISSDILVFNEYKDTVKFKLMISHYS